MQPRDPRHLAVRAVLEYEQGDFARGAAQIERLLETTRSSPRPGPVADHVFVSALIPLACRIAGVDERLELAEARAEAVLSLPRLVPALALLARSGLALIAAERGDAEGPRKGRGAP